MGKLLEAAYLAIMGIIRMVMLDNLVIRGIIRLIIKEELILCPGERGVGLKGDATI